MTTKAPFTYKLPQISAGKNRFEKVYNIHQHYTGIPGEENTFIDSITGNSIPKTHDSYTFKAPKGAGSIKATIGFTSPYGDTNELWVWFNNEPMLPKIVYSNDPRVQEGLQYVGGYYPLTRSSDSYSASFTLAKGENSINVMGWESVGQTIQPVDFWIELEPLASNKTSKSKKSKKAKPKKLGLSSASSEDIQTILNSAVETNAYDYKEWLPPASRLTGLGSSHLAGTELDIPSIGLTIDGLPSSQPQVFG